MHPDLIVADDAQIKALRDAFLDFIQECEDFAQEVEESEAECGAMSILRIQQHLRFLRATTRELKAVAPERNPIEGVG